MKMKTPPPPQILASLYPLSSFGQSLSLHNTLCDSTMFFPPLNFTHVSDGVYRSASPTEINFPFLSTLHLKTVVVLSSVAMVEDDRFMKFVADNGVDVVHVADDHFPVAEDKVTRVLKIITDLSRYPVLLTSRDGKSFVCLVVGCLRKLQKWSLVSIYDEYRRFSAGSVQQQHEEQFLELFDIDSPLLSKEDN